MKPFYYYPFLFIGKFIGPVWFFLFAVHFRKWARNAVYNRVFQTANTDRLSRLWQRHPFRSYDYWILQNRDQTYSIGRVEVWSVSRFQFWFAFWFIWIWCDDDSVSDTYDDRHALSYVYGKRRNKLWGKLFRRWLKVNVEKDSKAFNCGDDIEPRFRFMPALTWQLRNTTMNFKYWYNY